MAITPTGPGQPPEGRPQDLTPLTNRLKNTLDAAISELRLAFHQPHLIDNPSSLESIADAIIALDGPSKDAAKVKG